MTKTNCACGNDKAERARVCFTCLAAEPVVTRASVTIAIGEPGPRYYALRADGTSTRFATYAKAHAFAFAGV